ncbi:MAG: hypothetical protein IJ461_07845 [Clostridia bacterium]|nr:hypothetical protein [Clostridia bacterium]
MIRFLRYSLDHGRRIKAVLMENDKMAQVNLTVTALDEESFTYTSSTQKRPRTLPLTALMAAGYARGDNGESD